MNRLIIELKAGIREIYPGSTELLCNNEPLQKTSYWFRPAPESTVYINIVEGVTDNPDTFRMRIVTRPKEQIEKFEKTYRRFGKAGSFGQNTDENLVVTQIAPDYYAISEIQISGKKLSSRMTVSGKELLTWGSLGFEVQGK